MNPMDGRRGYWLRQFSDTAERTTARILATLTGLGAGDMLNLKVADGLTWQGAIDSLTPIHSLDDLATLALACAAAGVLFAPVVVPRGLAGEADFHAQIAEACGSLTIDLEPYDGFWDRAPFADALHYLSELQARATEAYIVLQPDPRPYAVSIWPPEQLAPFASAFCPQHYVGWTETGWTNVQAEVAAFYRYVATGRDVGVTLWGEGDLSLARSFYDQVAGKARFVQWFAFGEMDTADLKTAAGFPTPQPTPAPDPTPQPDPGPAKPFLDELERYKLIGFIEGGSGVADLTTWINGHQDAPTLARRKR